MCHVITILPSRRGMRLVNRVKVFLVVTCSLEVDDSVWVSRERPSGSEQECSDNRGTHGQRQCDRDTCSPPLYRRGRCSHAATSPGLRPSSSDTFYHAAETQLWPRPAPSTVGFSAGPDHWRGLASCWVGEFEGFFPQLTVHESTKCAIKTICSWSAEAAQWQQTAEPHTWHVNADSQTSQLRQEQMGTFISLSYWDIVHVFFFLDATTHFLFGFGWAFGYSADAK